jgi:hypothetical protein
MRSLLLAIRMLLALAALWFLGGCQKENPVAVLPSDVAGTYDFTTFIFIPDAAAIAPANVLDTLVSENTNLRLTASGQFVLSYQFRQGPESLIAGTFDVTQRRITLKPYAGSEAQLTSLLLDSPLVLNRTDVEGVLEASIRKTADLAAFSNRYRGVPPVQGTLRLRLVQRSVTP